MVLRLKTANDQIEQKALRLCRRLRDERGISLIITMGILAVLSVTGATLIEYSNSNARSARYSASSETAYTLAEAGVNQALAVLNNSANNVDLSTVLPSTTTTYQGGTVTWSGTLDYTVPQWTITSTGNVANLSGGSTVHRTVTATVPITTPVTGSLGSDSWDYIFAAKTNDPDLCDMYVRNNMGNGARLYAEGNVCLKNNVSILGGPVVIHGRLSLENNANVGTTGARVEVYVGGNGSPLMRCKYGNSGSWTADCTDSQNIFSKIAGSGTSGANYTPPSISMPIVDWNAAYAAAVPGPTVTCTGVTGAVNGTVPVWDDTNTTLDNNAGTFELTPASSYTCRVGPAASPIGELSWNAATRVLTVRGTMYFDGSVSMSNGSLNSYTGQGVLYVSGVFTTSNNTKMCASITGSSCTMTGTSGWDPNTRMLSEKGGFMLRSRRGGSGRREAPGVARRAPTDVGFLHIEPCMRFSSTRLTDILHRRIRLAGATAGLVVARRWFR